MHTHLPAAILILAATVAAADVLPIPAVDADKSAPVAAEQQPAPAAAQLDAENPLDVGLATLVAPRQNFQMKMTELADKMQARRAVIIEEDSEAGKLQAEIKELEAALTAKNIALQAIYDEDADLGELSAKMKETRDGFDAENEKVRTVIGARIRARAAEAEKARIAEAEKAKAVENDVKTETTKSDANEATTGTENK